MIDCGRDRWILTPTPTLAQRAKPSPRVAVEREGESRRDGQDVGPVSDPSVGVGANLLKKRSRAAKKMERLCVIL